MRVAPPLSARLRSPEGRIGWRAILAALVLALIVFFIVDPQWVVKKILPPGSGSAVASSSDLNPHKYVADNWTKRILPALDHQVVALPKLMRDLKTDRARTVSRYGHVATSGGQPTFVASGKGVVVSVNTSGIPAYASVAASAHGKPAVQIALGPVLTGTAVRDALRYLSFNSFEDQVTYSEVASAINNKIDATVLSHVNNASLKGKRIRFEGAFTLQPGLQQITPVRLTVAR